MTSMQKLLAVALLTSVSATAMATSVANPASTPGIDKRQVNQEKRIDQGIATGTLNAAEAARLNQGQAKIETAKELAKADGVVTKHERKKLHRMQDHASKRIYRQKHDAQSTKSKF